MKNSYGGMGSLININVSVSDSLTLKIENSYFENIQTRRGGLIYFLVGSECILQIDSCVFKNVVSYTLGEIFRILFISV